MKKIILFPLIFIGVIIIGAISMFLFQLCPPDGPWSMPPWCGVYGNDPTYEYKDLPYITETFPPTDKNLDMGIGTMDIWGNSHIWVDVGEDTTKNVEPTMKRIGDIGGETLLFTDITVLQTDAGVLIPTKKQAPYEYNILEKELKNMVKDANDNGINKVILITNLASTQDEVDVYKESAERIDNGFEKWIATRYYENIEKNVGLSTPETLSTFSEEQWDKVFERWKEVAVYEAKKAEAAGVEYIIITPGDSRFEYDMPYSYLSKKYNEIIPEVRKNFSGKIGFFGGLSFLTNVDTSQVDFLAISFDAAGEPEVREAFSNVNGEDINSIKSSWRAYFNNEKWKQLDNKEKYLFTTITSYDGALKGGWIYGLRLDTPLKKDYKEQALGYEGLFEVIYEDDIQLTGVVSAGYWWHDRQAKNMRNDLMHTIRNKDAEHVFYKWSNIFN